MKRKDDDLLRLAFGELSDDAARAVEARADAADRAEIAAFRQLREGLQHLPPPPPDGLTAERLRAAILDRELSTRRKPFAWGPMLFAPVALAALAFAVLLPRLRPADRAVAIVGPELSSEFGETRLPDFKPLRPIREPSPLPVPVSKAIPAAQARKLDEDAPLPVSRRRSQRVTVPPVEAERREDQLVASIVAPSADEEAPKPKLEAPRASAPVMLARREPQTIAPPPSTIVERQPGQGGSTETVVIVSNQRDLETGALAATEKEVSSVLVGG